MASAETLEYRSDLCGKSCGENNCHCTNVSNNNILHHDEVNSNGIEIIAKGQSMLILALRTLRLSKSNQLNQFAVNADEQILAEEKCRPTISLREVLEHDCIDDCWIVLFDRVYNVTDFLHQVKILLAVCPECAWLADLQKNRILITLIFFASTLPELI